MLAFQPSLTVSVLVVEDSRASLTPLKLCSGRLLLHRLSIEGFGATSKSNLTKASVGDTEGVPAELLNFAVCRSD